MSNASDEGVQVPEGREDKMQQLVLDIARSLVDHPDAVTVEPVREGDVTTLCLRVAPADIGKVIGKQGRTARSLRTILGAASMKLQHRYLLDIIEDPADDTAAERD